MVTDKIKMIQRQGRKYIRRVRQIRENKNKKMTLIKSFAKGYLAKRKVLEYRSMVCKIRYIQRFYKSRHQMKDKIAVRIQKFMKGLKQFRKYKQLAKVKKGTITILS
jgi:hypothetical protein